MLDYIPQEIISENDLIAGGRFNTQLSKCFNKEEAKEYWKRNIRNREAVFKYHKSGFGNLGATPGHIIPAIETVVKKGFKHIYEKAKKTYNSLTNEEKNGSKGEELRAIMISTEIPKKLAKKYAEECRRLKDESTTPETAEHLEQMAEESYPGARSKTDPTKGNTPLTGATVILEIGNDERDFDEVEPGVYELEFDTDDYEAFFESNVLTGTIKISKADYISDEVDITIVVEIEEITPGIPTFYFLIIIGVIMAVMGALITYKVIQISKIPKFVKRTRKLKKRIKSGAEISEDILYPSKENFIVKELYEKFKIIGISSKEIFGLKEPGKITFSTEKNRIKSKGGNK